MRLFKVCTYLLFIIRGKPNAILHLMEIRKSLKQSGKVWTGFK